MRKISVFLTLGLVFFSLTARASDYKDWVPLLPDSLGGMGRSGDSEGMNMDMSGQKWSSLQQQYSAGDGSKSVELIIVGGKGAPQLANFQMMSAMKMETEDQIVKTLDVFGYKGLINLAKKEKSGTLMISLSKEMLVVLDAKPITKEEEILKLAEQLPLAKFAAQAK